MSGRDDLNFALSSLLFDQFKQEPEPRGMNAIVYFFEEIQALTILFKQSSQRSKETQVPSDTL